MTDVADSLIDISADIPVESDIQDEILAVGETWTYTYRYKVTQADVDAGKVHNSVSATAKTPKNKTVPPSGETEVIIQ